MKFIILILFVSSCGLKESEYVSYKEEATDTLNCEEAQAAFSTIGTLVDSTCAGSGCHGDGQGNLTLTAGQSDQNRQNLKATSLGEDAQKLFDKLSGAATHSGGTYDELTLEVWQTWLTAEANCLALRG